MSDVLDTIRERIQCRFPLMFLSTWEEERWESELATLALDIDRGLVVWTSTEGASPPLHHGPRVQQLLPCGQRGREVAGRVPDEPRVSYWRDAHDDEGSSQRDGRARRPST